ncbi:LlaJI family restriction endonuclease [Methanobrevibacter sp.]|uniref:LlaJI family restriction endonuclease n=1 Tax=Methanobrevibacter sp. TaxID=66852 RepID=UPI0026E07119|nr:LlaJI family restriction endonuclease [Methanobrevibacter sp.]MDO5824267.1 LlaJI family restriction endonuclease [Methanobrevibacter sp.]
MTSNNTLRDRINVVKHDSENRFVGLKANGGDALVYFPIGYRLSETDEEIRRDILKLFDILNEFKDKKEGSITEKKYEESHDVEFPINAYLEIIRYYLENGYYTEVEPVYKTREKGKIDWSRTIKQQKPLLSLNRNNCTYSPIYTLFTVKQSTPNENNEITRIHQHCVRISFERVGWIFTSFMPPKAGGPFDDKRFLSILRTKLANTNNDNKKRLFQSMIDIIESIDEDEHGNKFHFGTNSFENVWEGLIDKAFGTEEKIEYYPKACWILSDGERSQPSHPLQPDSIMCANDSEDNYCYFVLDAKYYQYGDSNNKKDLPQNADINKQITYAENIEINKKINPNNIYNAFLIPFNNENEEKFPSDKPFFNIGAAVSEWKKNEKNYEYIQGILVDTKFLMDSYRSKSTENKMKLANTIECACKENRDRLRNSN